MGAKRKGVGTGRGAIKKKHKVPKAVADEEKDILAIKIAAKTAIKTEYHDIVLPWIEKKSIECTKICELASLLFLNKVRAAFEREEWDFFDDGDGIHIIEGCFYAVLIQHKDEEDMLPEFRTEFQQVDIENQMQWPNNKYFGNTIKYLYQQYARNVITNLTTHAKKRITQFLRYCVFHENNNNPNDHFDEDDVKNAVNWAIKRYDSTRGNVGRLNKRDHLLGFIRANGGPADDDVAKFTRENWFQSFPMWLNLQETIDRYHDWQQQQQQQNGQRTPKLKNLSVIPICTHLRKPIKIDADVLYRMMCETKLIPKDENGIQVTVGYVCQHKEFYFDQIFNMEKINRMLKANKEFHYHIVTDGVSMSILYKVSKKVLEQMESDGIVKKKYYEGFYVYEIGIDPGMKTWLAVVRRHIDTGKEVCIVFVNF